MGEDANRVYEALGKRLAKYKLRMNKEKTKLVSFSKNKAARGEKQESFDFLGFTFYLGRSRKGRVIPKMKTSGKKVQSKTEQRQILVQDSKKRDASWTNLENFPSKNPRPCTVLWGIS